VILISHDRHLIEASADRLWLVANGTVTPYDNDIEDYRRLVLEGTRASGGKTAVADTGLERRKAGADKRAQSAPLRKEIKQTEALIAKLQKELEVVDGKLGNGTLYADPAKAGALAKSRADTVKAIEAAEERWLSLSDEHERAVADAG
jgi:ATP-binding cassette subfamily F protein 3